MPHAYTHGHAEPVLRSHRWRTAENSAAHLLPHLRPGDRLLDVGAGPATITLDLARRVRSVTALEVDEATLALTREAVHAAGRDDVELLAGDVHALELPDHAYDVVHAHQVLQHVADPVQALREMRRVCRPGGVVAVRDADYAGFTCVVAVRDADYAGFTWWPGLPALDAWLALYRAAARGNGGEPDAGRRLLSWARAAGFSEVTATSSTWCFASPDDRAWWGSMWADRITGSDVARSLLASGAASREDLEELAQGWRDWAAADDGWLSVLHGELVCRA